MFKVSELISSIRSSLLWMQSNDYTFTYIKSTSGCSNRPFCRFFLQSALSNKVLIVCMDQRSDYRALKACFQTHLKKPGVFFFFKRKSAFLYFWHCFRCRAPVNQMVWVATLKSFILQSCWDVFFVRGVSFFFFRCFQEWKLISCCASKTEHVWYLDGNADLGFDQLQREFQLQVCYW